MFLDADILAKYVSENIKSAVNRNLQLDVHLLDQIKQVLYAIVKIYKSDKFVDYQPFIGDIRKVKRLINTMMMFDIQTIDFNNSDYDTKDLAHLLLIYINYPNVFRKIYNSETGGKNGFFSLDLSDDPKEKDKYINSSEYTDYVSELGSVNQKYLLDRVFDITAAFEDEPNSGNSSQNIPQAAPKIRACFNGKGYTDRNLERYLNLIVKLSKQDKRDAYQFYVGIKKKLLEGESLETIFLEKDFDFSDGEFRRNQLWTIVSNSATEFNPVTGAYIVSYLLDHLPEYSFLGSPIGVASRTSLIYSLLKFLDESAWGSSQSGRPNNTDKNISEIADWVFGEKGHKDAGVVNTLAKADRGPLGLYDMLIFVFIVVQIGEEAYLTYREHFYCIATQRPKLQALPRS